VKEADEDVGPSSEWVLYQEFKTKMELNAFLSGYTHKLTATHGNQKSSCIKHGGSHPQLYGYMKCSSLKFYSKEEDKCFFRLKVTRLPKVY